MIEDFLAWMADDFVRFFDKAMKMAAVLVGAVFLLPLWLLPFLWWFFVARKKEKTGLFSDDLTERMEDDEP